MLIIVSSAFAQDRAQGIVKDESGRGLAGVSVTVQGTRISTLSDLSGKFILEGVSSGTALEISAIGYETQKVFWDNRPLTIVLKEKKKKNYFALDVGYMNAKDVAKNDNGVNESTKTRGFYFGFKYNFNLVAGLGIAPGFYANALFGNEISSILTGFSSETKTKEIDLNVPIHVTYTLPLNRTLAFFFYAGPTFQYGLSRNSESKISGMGATMTVTADYYKEGYYKRFNVYMGGGAGIQISHFQLLVGYDHTVTDMYSDSNIHVGRGQVKVGLGVAF